MLTLCFLIYIFCGYMYVFLFVYAELCFSYDVNSFSIFRVFLTSFKRRQSTFRLKTKVINICYF